MPMNTSSMTPFKCHKNGDFTAYCVQQFILPDKHDWNGTARHFAVQLDVSHSEVYAKCCFRTERVRRRTIS